LGKTMWSPNPQNSYQRLAVKIPEIPILGEQKKKKDTRFTSSV